MKDFKKTVRLKEGDRINIISKSPFSYTLRPLDESDVYTVTEDDISVLENNTRTQFKDGKIQPL